MAEKVLVKPRTSLKPKTERPKLWKVILLNDDFTPREFVVQVLKAVFRMGEEQERVPASSPFSRKMLRIPRPRKRRSLASRRVIRFISRPSRKNRLGRGDPVHLKHAGK